MQLLVGECEFLERRRRLVRSWRYVGVGLLLLLVGLGCWLYFKNPLLANPTFVVEALQRGGIEQGTIELMAAMLPIAVVAIFVLCTVFVLLAFAVFANEARYLAIISRETGNATATPNDTQQARWR